MIRVFPLLLAFIFCSQLAVGDEMEDLVDQLVNVSEPGFGYSGYFTGSEFLPYDDSGEMGGFVYGRTYHARSEELRKIVEKGVDAVQALLAHIGDDRKIRLEPMTGMMWMDFTDEYDFNRRTRSDPPKDVNRRIYEFNGRHPTSHAITVGDLCFVALGQIVNRSFSATRYQPTGGLIVSSPSYSKQLRDVVTADWMDLTAESHRQTLIQDFKNPDGERRRTGAYLRLSFYYPETVESLVMDELVKPTLDVNMIEEFCREKLYKSADENVRKQLYSQFIKEHGDSYSIGIVRQLFDDLKTLEADEERRISPRLTHFGTQPRELLIQLFAESANVKSSDRPHADFHSEASRVRFIGTLTHDKGQRIGEEVRKVFIRNADDAYLAPACLSCLANRGYGEFLVKQLERINVADTEVNDLHLQYLVSISSSDESVVQARLREIVATTANGRYFIAALAGLDKSDDTEVLDRAKEILDGLPENSDQGSEILQMVGERFPNKAREICSAFLESKKSERIKTVCNVFWYGHPLSKEILSPLLDDKRHLEGFPAHYRICDRAATAISHTTDEIQFDSDWSLDRKDEAILQLKEYCQKAR